MDLPHFPEDQAEPPARAPITLRAKLVGAIIVITLVLIIVLHLAGVIGESQVGH